MRFAPAFLDELRRRTPLSELVSRHGVKLDRRGREFAALCPLHHEKTPSFYIVEDQRFFHCFGCGAHGDAIEFLRRVENLDFRAAVAKLAAATAGALPGSRAAPLSERSGQYEKQARNRRLAWRIWTNGRDPHGTPVETYLRNRGLCLPPAPVLRFAPSCFNRETGRQLPAMLARVDGADGEFVAVHRTWLRPDGSGKAELREPKWSLGAIAGAAVRLAPPVPVLAITEGIEDALSVIVATGIPAWSAVSKSGFKRLVLPPEVSELLIVADNDVNGQGLQAARLAGERWAAEGRRVRLALPPLAGEDANALLLKGGAGGCETMSKSWSAAPPR